VIYLFGAVALFILAIACINFMNLSTARSAGRAREVGMRKVMGAFRKDLVTQFLGESLLLTLLGVVLALVFVAVGLPKFSAFSKSPCPCRWPTPLLGVPGGADAGGRGAGGYVPGVFPVGLPAHPGAQGQVYHGPRLGVACAKAWWWCSSAFPCC
jgi:putative ABC transport system permease protein